MDNSVIVSILENKRQSNDGSIKSLDNSIQYHQGQVDEYTHTLGRLVEENKKISNFLLDVLDRG